MCGLNVKLCSRSEEVMLSLLVWCFVRLPVDCYSLGGYVCLTVCNERETSDEGSGVWTGERGILVKNALRKVKVNKQNNKVEPT